MDIAALLLLAAALAIPLVAGLLLRRRKATNARLARRLSDLDARLDALVQGLAATVEKARHDSLRVRAVESLDRAVELDEQLARCAEANRAASFSPTRYYYPAGEPEPAPAGSSVAVPLEVGSRRLGSLTVFGLGEEPPVPGAELDTLEAISRCGAPALETARSLADAEPPPAPDDRSGLGNRESCHETLALLVARAVRHGGRLAVCVLDLDDFKLVNVRIGQLEADRLLEETADALRETVRVTDLVYRTGADEFAVILPDSGRIDAESLYARLQAALGLRQEVRAAHLTLSAGIAELAPEDDGVSLFERAQRALGRAKQARTGAPA